MVSYCVFKEHIIDEHLGKYDTYGIETSNGSSISDISLECDELEQLVQEMNSGELDLIHFTDVVEDFILR